MATDRPRDAGFATRAVHAGESPDGATGGVEAPLVRSSAFAFESAADARAQFEGKTEGCIYGRWRNPNVASFEAKMAALEGAEAAVALASGMAAVEAALTVGLGVGDRVLAPLGVYAETAKLLRGRLARFGIGADFVDMRDLDAVERSWTDATRVVWCETPANPRLTLYDIEALSALARARGARLVVDGTFATPYHQQPLSLGADLVVHSATKAIGGHGDALGGVVSGPAEPVAAIREDAVRTGGAILSPDAAWLLARGLRTLPLRMERASANAATLAARLEADPRVATVAYPGLASHPQHPLARRQLRRGFGALVAFELRGGRVAGERCYDRLRLITRAVSLGDVRSLITHPASTTHASMPEPQRRAAGITDGLFRLSVGIEDVEDLWADLDAAMG